MRNERICEGSASIAASKEALRHYCGQSGWEVKFLECVDCGDGARRDGSVECRMSAVQRSCSAGALTVIEMRSGGSCRSSRRFRATGLLVVCTLQGGALVNLSRKGCGRDCQRPRFPLPLTFAIFS